MPREHIHLSVKIYPAFSSRCGEIIERLGHEETARAGVFLTCRSGGWKNGNDKKAPTDLRTLGAVARELRMACSHPKIENDSIALY